MELTSLIGIAAAAITGLITIVAGLKTFYRSIIVPVKEHFEGVHQCFKDVKELKEKVNYELNPNGGKSLKDQLRNLSKGLERLESLTLSILSCSDRGVWISDENGCCIWVNEWFDTKLNWNVSEMLGNGWKNVIIPHEREAVAREFSDSVKDGRDFIMDYSYIDHKDSSKSIRVHVVCHPIKRNTGEIVGFIGFATELEK